MEEKLIKWSLEFISRCLLQIVSAAHELNEAVMEVSEKKKALEFYRSPISLKWEWGFVATGGSGWHQWSLSGES